MSVFHVWCVSSQDAVWTWGQVMSGCFLLILVYRYGPLAFRRDVVNKVRTRPSKYVLLNDGFHDNKSFLYPNKYT